MRNPVRQRGIQTIFAPMRMAVSTANGLNPPTGLFRVIPP